MEIDQDFHFHSLSARETAEKLETDPEKGISESEIKERKEKYGENKLPEKGKKTAFKIFVEQFKDFLIFILVIAAAISWYVGEMADVYIIAGVILFNAIMGFVQEYRAEKAIEAIKDLVKHKTGIIRSGEEKTVEATEVVPGDLIVLKEGMTVPADAKLIRTKNLRTIEASLTGESVPAEKEVSEDPKDSPIAERKSMVFKGTQVARGSGKALVTAIGLQTEIGNIAGSLSEMESTSSAFKDKTNRLAKIMAGLAVSTALIVFLVGYFVRGFEFNEILLVTIATMVSSIPEGLPVVISIVLAIGARKMASKNAIIRKFTATEMLGSVTTILTDKTGTITESLLTVKKMFINKDLETEVSGKGHDLKGKITANDKEITFGDDSRLNKMALIAAYCQTAKAEVISEEEEEEESDDKVKKDKHIKRDRVIEEDDDVKKIYEEESFKDKRYENGKRIIEEHHEETHKEIHKTEESGEGDEDREKDRGGEQKGNEDNKSEESRNENDANEASDGKGVDDDSRARQPSVTEADDLEITGDPTEAALLVLSYKARVREEGGDLKIIDDLPFNSEAKFRASLVEFPDGHREIFAVGAPERILEKSSKIISADGSEALNGDFRDKIASITDSYTEEAMRVVSLAFKEVSKSKEDVNHDDVDDLVWTGLTGIIDPPREGVKEAIKAARDAGIRVIMVTGDHKKTAFAIAREVGITDDDGKSLAADEISENDDEFAEQVDSTEVFARVDPDTKLRIAEHLQNKGELVGMTGDGVNDAPALKRADVGIAMGSRGTDVAKDSAQIVLSDDNFSSIINAIEQGRIVFKNLRNTSFFLITTNFAATMTIVVCIALSFPLPLLAAQILFVNLVTDGVMDVALATEPGHGDVMKQKPYGKEEPILNRQVIPYIVLVGGVMITLTVLVFKHYLPDGTETARAGAFLAIAMTQLFNAFNMRSPNESIFKIGLTTNKWILLAFFVSLGLQIVVLKIHFFKDLFSFGNIAWTDIGIIFLLSSLVLVIGEIWKWLKNKFQWDI